MYGNDKGCIYMLMSNNLHCICVYFMSVLIFKNRMINILTALLLKIHGSGRGFKDG